MMDRLRKPLLLLAFIFIRVASSAKDGDSDTYLRIMPEKADVSLESSLYLSCTAHVPNTDLVTHMRWWGPNGAEIPSRDGLISLLEGLNQNQLDLLINHVRKEHTGMYNCTAFYAGNQPLNSHIIVESHMDIKFQDVQPKQTPVTNRDAKIKCIVTADPLPHVDWLKDGQAIKANDPRLITKPDGILIKNITEADEGVYRCRARVPQLGQIEYRDIQVEVHVPPVITGAPQDITGVEKDSATFQCIATGKPAPSYSWVNNENEVLNDKEGFYVDEITGELQIMDLKPEHAGSYRCTARNQADEVTAEARLTVLTKPKVEEYRNVTAGVDDNAEMRCIVTGDPLPVAVFWKEGAERAFVTGVNDDDRITVEQRIDDEGRRLGVMRIQGVMRADDGLYTCTGNSSGGVTVVWGHITVEFPPTFEDQPQDKFWSWEQKPVNVTCLATSIPNATVQWYLREEPIRETDPNLEVLSRGPNGTLRVTPLDGSYFDVYTCLATNSKGTAEHDVSLSQVHQPGPVQRAEPLKTTATTVSWSIVGPADDGGLPVRGFSVRYRFEDTSWDKGHSLYWAKGSSYIVDELMPQERYRFTFAARNDVGEGEWSGEKSVRMEKRSSPEEPFIFGAAEGVVKNIPYSNFYVLQWKVPLSNGEPIDHFQIMYYKVQKNDADKWDVVGSKVPVLVAYPEKQSSYRITGLQGDTHYKIELRAHNEIGYSTPSEIVIKTGYDSTSSVGNEPGSSGEYSSGGVGVGGLRTTTTMRSSLDATAGTTDASSSTSGGDLNVSLLVVGVVVAIVVLCVFVDVALFFAKDVGVTAFVVRKFSSPVDKEKDKEAMLQDAANAKEDKESILKEEKDILKEEEMENKQKDSDDLKGEAKDSPV